MTAPRHARRLWVVIGLVIGLSVASQAVRLNISLMALHLGATPAAVGVLIALFSVFPMVGSIPAGRVVDRMGPFVPIVVTATIMSVVLGALFVMPTLPALFVAAACFGIALSVCHLALLNLIVRTADAHERALRLGSFTTAWAIGGVFGPVFAGVVIDTLGYRAAFVLTMPFTLAILVTFVAWRALRQAAPGSAAPRHEDREGQPRVIDLLRVPRLRDAMVVGAAISAVYDLFGFVIPVYGRQVGFSPSTIGIVVGCLSVGSVIVRPLLPAIMRRYGPWTTIASVMGLGAIAYALFPLVQSAVAWCIFACALGITAGIGQPINHAMIFAVAPPGRQGEAFGVRMAIGHLIHVAGPVSFGALTTTLGLAPVVWAMSALLGGVAWFSHRRARDGRLPQRVDASEPMARSADERSGAPLDRGGT